jgi:ATP-dependent Clp protease ATP-binding subunit ClpC
VTLIDVTGFGDDAREAVGRAEMIARELGFARVGTEHLLLGVLTGSNPAAHALVAAGATVAAARHKVVETAGANGAPTTAEQLELSSRASRAIGRSHRFSHNDRSEAVGADHLLLGVLDVEGTAGQVLRGIGVDIGALRQALIAPRPAPVTAASMTDVVAATCPQCRATVDALTFTIVKASDADGRAGDAVVFSCRACGVVLGVSRAREA